MIPLSTTRFGTRLFVGAGVCLLALTVSISFAVTRSVPVVPLINGLTPTAAPFPTGLLLAGLQLLVVVGTATAVVLLHGSRSATVTRSRPPAGAPPGPGRVSPARVHRGDHCRSRLPGGNTCAERRDHTATDPRPHTRPDGRHPSNPRPIPPCRVTPDAAVAALAALGADVSPATARQVSAPGASRPVVDH